MNNPAEEQQIFLKQNEKCTKNHIICHQIALRSMLLAREGLYNNSFTILRVMDYRSYMKRIQSALDKIKATDEIQESMAGGCSKRVK
jgi:hypothetical protein